MAPSDKDPASSEPSKDTIKPVEASDVAPTKPADSAADPKPDDNQENTTTEFDEDEYSESDDDFPQFEGGQPRGKADKPVSAGNGQAMERPPRPRPVK
ncbi:hypothetical protein D9611_010424 [Ephemerocybe angulata]|uniref:Uncharacterized protein n=1 Tax=Ephemerocybe angulata TaxID=980116 RepID=A0A8H5BX59_9AGAR|nr:hypothetical protein D9611_010424 [Tulosesus angulatus]